MRLTQVLLKQSHRFNLKNLWRVRGHIKEVGEVIPPFLEKKGIPVTNAVDLVTKERKFIKYEPPVPDDPRYIDQFGTAEKPEDHPDYNDEHAYEFNPECRLAEGLNQACVLTKTQTFEGLPDVVKENIDVTSVPSQDTLVPRYIMQANVWDPTKEKLPRRYDASIPGWSFKAEFGIPQKRINSILIRRLVSLCQKIGAQHPSLHASRAVGHDHSMSAIFTHGERLIRAQATFDTLVMSTQPLPQFAPHDVVDASVVHKLPDLYPLAPTIDLKKQHIYKQQCDTGWPSDFSHCFPHMLFLPYINTWNTEENLAVGLLVAHAQSLATARALNVADTDCLETPINTQCVLTNGSVFHFICFQLNTLQNENTRGVKNLAWIDRDNLLYNKILPKRAMLRNTKYEDYDPEVFKKLVAMYVAGGDLSQHQQEKAYA